MISDFLFNRSPRSLLVRLLGLNFLAIALALAIGIPHGNLASQFGETKFITKFSALQLLAVGWLAFQIFKARRPAPPAPAWRTPALLWAIIAAGFCFLALDELLKIHERMDEWIHLLFGIQQTALTDRIDDLIVGLYGLIGLVVLGIYRAELKLFRPAIPYFIGGFILLFAMVAVDVGANAKDVLPALVREEQVKTALQAFTALEESFKILGEAVFILAFHRALFQLKSTPPVPA